MNAHPALKGKFDIPRYQHNSCEGARRVYREFFGFDWHESDDYLRQLAREAHDCTQLIYLMRECQEV